MARTWQEGPANLPLETPLGTVYLTVTEGRRIYVSTNGGHNARNSVVIRGIPYHLSLHLADYGEGFVLSNGNGDGPASSPYELSRGTYMTRQDKILDEASESARRKARDIIIPLVHAWAKAHPDMLQAGERAYASNAISRLEEKIAEHEQAITKLRAEIEELRKRAEA